MPCNQAASYIGTYTLGKCRQPEKFVRGTDSLQHAHEPKRSNKVMIKSDSAAVVVGR